LKFNLKDFNLEVFWKVWNQNLKLYFRSFEWGTYYLCIFDIIGATVNFVKYAGKKRVFLQGTVVTLTFLKSLILQIKADFQAFPMMYLSFSNFDYPQSYTRFSKPFFWWMVRLYSAKNHWSIWTEQSFVKFQNAIFFKIFGIPSIGLLI
jgi:hypothetical protein